MYISVASGFGDGNTASFRTLLCVCIGSSYVYTHDIIVAVLEEKSNDNLLDGEIRWFIVDRCDGRRSGQE